MSEVVSGMVENRLEFNSKMSPTLIRRMWPCDAHPLAKFYLKICLKLVNFELHFQNFSNSEGTPLMHHCTAPIDVNMQPKKSKPTGRKDYVSSDIQTR